MLKPLIRVLLNTTSSSQPVSSWHQQDRFLKYFRPPNSFENLFYIIVQYRKYMYRADNYLNLYKTCFKIHCLIHI